MSIPAAGARLAFEWDRPNLLGAGRIRRAFVFHDVCEGTEPVSYANIIRVPNRLNSKHPCGTLGPMFRNTYLRAFSTLYYLNLDFIRFLGSLLQSRSALAR
jgi:hypothetical protein